MKDKNSLFLLACQENNFEEVKKLVLDCDIDSFDEWERNALQIVCKNNNLEMAEFLIKHGAKVDVNDRYMDSPLLEAAKNNNKKLVKLILEQKITYPLCNDNEYDDYFGTSIIDKDYLGINEDIKELLIKAEEEAKKKRNIAYLERKKRRSEIFAKIFAKEHREEMLEKEFVETGFTIEYKYDSDKKSYSVNKKYH